MNHESKEKTMTRAAILMLVCFGCPMTLPSLAHARYRDGMNQYAYANSNPARYADPEGLTIKEFKGCTPAQQSLLRDGEEVVKKAIFTLQVLPQMQPGAFAEQLLDAGGLPSHRNTWLGMDADERKERLRLYETWVRNVARKAGTINAWIAKGWVADCCGDASKAPEDWDVAYVNYAIPDTIFFIKDRIPGAVQWHKRSDGRGFTQGLAGVIGHEASHLAIRSVDRMLSGVAKGNLPQIVGDAYWWGLILEEGYHVELGSGPHSLSGSLFAAQLKKRLEDIPTPPAP